jgi:hypothetical protein
MSTAISEQVVRAITNLSYASKLTSARWGDRAKTKEPSKNNGHLQLDEIEASPGAQSVNSASLD